MNTKLALQIMREHRQNGYAIDNHRIKLYIEFMEGPREEVIITSIKQLMIELGY